ncbi:MAG: pyruvate kinase [Thiobacillus sp.]|nr:pyruvate kinase [Thiobacillus sp.]
MDDLTVKKRTDRAGLGGSDVESVLSELSAIRSDLVENQVRSQPLLSEIHANYRDSSRNLLHYLALRRRDLRPLQLRLAAMGLSSLGRAESNVLATVDEVLHVLHRLAKRAWQPAPQENPVNDFSYGERLLAEHTDALLGPASKGRKVRIMVTMPSDAADDYLLVHNLLQQGMDCLRINCAHDDAAAWSRMIGHLRQAERALGRSCRVVMDLAGPKLRTGPLQPGPAVVRIRPTRDVYGRVSAPARVWLTSEDVPQPPPSPANACLPVPSTWLAEIRIGESVKFTDARDARRTFRIVDVTDHGCWAETDRSAYIVPGITLRHVRGADKSDDSECRIGALTPGEAPLILQKGDLLVVTRDLKPGRPATYDSAGKILTPAMIGCTIPEVFDDVRAGEPIWFDDGKIGGVIEKVGKTRVWVRITQDHVKALKLQADKGINLPESDLHLAAMTAKDIEDLSFATQHADIVELSFANSAHDVESLQQHLSSLGGRQPAIVLKIETRHAFENLPEMLLTAMRSPRCGVMIARGDLAVECGFERLAEVQEEILWLCEAAHVPVIWATQVLETLAKEGRPSRAEITDAAMGLRAECVMLNKGPYIVSAVRALDDILRRMHAHQAKKRSMLRELNLAHMPAAEPGAAASQSGMSANGRNAPVTDAPVPELER